MSNINENICQAIDIIIQERLSHISFDSTILCKIVDDSKKERGVYVVKSDEVRFEAYSTLNTLAVGDSVYVQIPNGDWNEQKFILSKKTLSDENPSLTYKNPFANFIDITGNLISDAQTTERGLLANGSQEEIEIWHYNATEQEEPLKGYTTLGIKAGFKTLLNPFHYYTTNNEYKTSSIIKGNYGLRLKIVSKLENVTSEKGITEGEPIKAGEYILELNETNMNGNPYNFFTYANQEIIFNISEIYNILSMSLVFYQKTGSFTDDTGYAIQSTQANLFANNIGVYLGYGVDEINEEKVLIYSNDSSTYSAEAVDKTANNKKVRLRWIYKDAVSGSFRSVQPSDGMNFEVRWYRYRLGMPPADEYSGIYWMPLSKQTYDVDNKKYIYEVQDEDWLKQYAGVKPDFLTSWIFSDTEQPIEKVKAVVLYNGQVYRSEILEFTNEKEVYSNDGIMDAVEDMFKELTALNIICKDDSFGNYFIYNEDYKLINQSDSAIPRQFLAYLALPDANGNYKDIQAPIDNAEQIKWYLPTDNTMIRFKNEDLTGFETSTETRQGIVYKVITKKADSSNQVHNSLTYYISSLYNHYYGNNNILCEVTLQDGTVYSSAKELSFGVSGSNGTDVKLVLDFLTPGINGLDINSGYVDVAAKLYDSTGKDITKEALNLSSTSWNWELVGNDTKGLYISDDLNSETNKRILKLVDDLNIFNTWNVLKCTLIGWGAYDLEAYLPIPIKQNILINSSNQLQGIFYDDYQREYWNLDEEKGIKLLNNTKFKIQINPTNSKANEEINTSDIINSSSVLIKNEYTNCTLDAFSCNITKKIINYEQIGFNFNNIEVKKEKYLLKFSINLLPLNKENLPNDIWNWCELNGESAFNKITPSFRIYLQINNGTLQSIDSKITSTNKENVKSFMTTESIPSKIFTDGERLNANPLVLGKENKFEIEIDFSDQEDISQIKTMGLFISGGFSNKDIYPYSIYNMSFAEENAELTSLEPLSIGGTTQVIYTTEGLPQYSRGIYTLYYQDIEGISNNTYNELLDWKLISDKKSTNPVLRIEEAYSPDGLTKNKIGYSLQPCQFYDSSSIEQNIIQAINHYGILWSQPILILQNTYFSSSINNWDGTVKVDEKGGLVAAPKIAAGIKTKDNKLTGVILGDYETKTSELQTGLYGFRDGETTFGFRADGTAFIGQSGAGRIDFDGEHSIIKSSSWDLVDVNNPNGEAAGTLFDLDNGLIKIQRNAKVITKDDKGNENEEIKSYLIKLDSSTTFGEDTYPFTIGEKFKVKWDGTLEATGGTFSGNITAKDGYIGKWTINENGLTNGNVHLWHEEDGKQYAFYSDNFKVTSGGSVTANDITVTNGKIQGTSSIQLQGQTVSIKATNGKGLIIDKDGARFTGDITMGPNTTISWNQISDKDWVEDELDIALDNASTALDNASTALDNASTALDTSDDALQNLKNLVLGLEVDIDGVSPTNSFIDQKFIYSPTLISPIISTNDLYINPKSVTDSGSLIFRGYNSNGTKTYDAFICEHEWNGGHPILTLSTSAAYTYFGSENTSFMTIRSGNTIIFDALTIDFNDCEIENLNVIPVFG